VARTTDKATRGLFTDCSTTIDLHETRITARTRVRRPWFCPHQIRLSLAMVASAGLTRRRSLLSAAVLVIALGAVITIVVDLDRPREGSSR
jgi:hypothetical protein